MKLTKSKLKQLIKEAFEDEEEIAEWTGKIEDDVLALRETLNNAPKEVLSSKHEELLGLLNRLVGESGEPFGDDEEFVKERAWIASYINAWFNQRATGSGGSLVDALRKGAQGVPGDPWKANVSFNKALREDGVIAPEDVDHFANALENLANAIVADNTLVDPKIIGKKGDWYKHAQGT